MGASIIMGVRNIELGEYVADQIRAQYPDAHVRVGPKLDLAEKSDIINFASSLIKSQEHIDVLINNAGTNYVKPWSTPEGIGGLCQVNYLGPYHLTRLLEDRLIASSPSRVVNVSSVMHRFGCIKDTESFLTSWDQGSKYANTKLANAVFAFELHRRLAPHGVVSCAVDPGGVASSIWKSSKLLSTGPIGWLINLIYAPPSDGATAVVHAASCVWDNDLTESVEVNSKMIARVKNITQNRSQKYSIQFKPSTKTRNYLPQDNALHEANDTRFYARGLFAWPGVASIGITNSGDKRNFGNIARKAFWSVSALVHSGLDWPMRYLTKCKWEPACVTKPVTAALPCYDLELAEKLWNVSADALKLPRKVEHKQMECN